MRGWVRPRANMAVVEKLMYLDVPCDSNRSSGHVFVLSLSAPHYIPLPSFPFIILKYPCPIIGVIGTSFPLVHENVDSEYCRTLSINILP
jgi:hypothetical protein